MAPPFHFKLEKVLEFRRSKEDQARLALAQAQKAHERQQEVLQGIKATLEEHLRKWEEKESFTMPELWLQEQYTRRLEQDIIEADAELQQLALKLQRCRQEALNRSRDRKLLEKLKDRQAEKHHAEEQHKEQKEFDEASAVRYEPPDL